MSGIRVYTPQELIDFRDELIQRSGNLQETAQPRLVNPLLGIENTLSNDIIISQPIGPMESGVVWGELNECKSLLDDLEEWNNRNITQPSSLVELLEKFASQTLVSGNHDVFVLEDNRVSIKRVSGMEFSIIRLKKSSIENPKHWCLIAHEVGAHLLKDTNQQPIFIPRLPQQKKKRRYGTAVAIWDGSYPPRRDGWFSEVYGDLWGCRRLGPGFLQGFIEYISSPNHDLNIGTREHPPSNLRITLMSRYLEVQGYPKNTLPYYTQLPTLQPILMFDDSETIPNDMKIDILAHGGEVYDLSDLLEVYDTDLIQEVERIGYLDLDRISSNTSEILASFQAITNGSIVGTNLVADISGLAMFLHRSNNTVDPFVSQLINTYL